MFKYAPVVLGAVVVLMLAMALVALGIPEDPCGPDFNCLK